MKTTLSLLVLSLLVLSIVPGVFAVSVGTGIIPDITTENFEPMVWMCDSRAVVDDNTEPGRNGAPSLSERKNNYAFEGESVSWKVLVFDKNGIEKVKDVYATVGDTQGAGNEMEANCNLDRLVLAEEDPRASCNARILEEDLQDLKANTAAYYTCTLTVETGDSMYGQHWVTVEAEDLDGLMGTMDENEYWFFNPIIALSIDGDLAFDDVRPGTSSYSSTILVGNDADEGSGVLLDMFISGTDFYDSASSGAKCSDGTNKLSLDAFRYFATSGAYSTVGNTGADAEGYLPIMYGIAFNDPNPFYDSNEIIKGSKEGAYYKGNVLTPGAEMALTFKLDLPEPCNGDFDTGSIYFFGEAI